MAWIPPPLDLPVEHAFDFHFERNPDHVAITHPSAVGDNMKTYTYRTLVPAIHRAGRAVVESITETSRPTSPVVVVLIKTDSIAYFTMIAGLLRAGLTPFPISSRFSANVIAHLMKESHPGAVLVDESTRDFVEQVLRDTGLEPPLCTLPSFLELYPGNNDYTPLPKHDRRPEDVSMLMHSSSSTSNFPKLIPWSSFGFTYRGEVKDQPLQHLEGKILGCFGLELFHAFGMCVFSTMVRRGLVLAMMDPLEPASILPVEASDVYRCFQISKLKMLLTNPRAIEEWAADPEKVAELRDAEVTLYFGGRFLNRNVGDKLVESGVKICSVYGGTEFGPITILPHFQADDWEYFAVSPRPDVNFVSRGEDELYELFIAPTEDTSYLSCVNAIWEGRPAYNPGDLFLAHPSKPHTYKTFGRLNDQIMLATGQAINPRTIEEELTRHPLIKSAVMFGHTRFKVGLVVEAPDSVFEQNEQGSYLEDIWPVVEGVNMMSPAHARVSREMLIAASPQKPISISPKGYPRRAMAWQQYQDEIDELYSARK